MASAAQRTSSAALIADIAKFNGIDAGIVIVTSVLRIAPIYRTAQTQKGNTLLALSCYAALFAAFVLDYREVVGVDIKHVPLNWQGRGPGRLTSGPGSVAATELCETRAWVVGASDAEARPAMATNKAKNRMTVFIFGNLSDSILKGESSPFQARSYRINRTKSSFFN